MAKLIVAESGMKYWALTKAEDYIIIDAIDTIEKFVPKTDDKFALLMNSYFVDGKMLGDFALICLNDHRRRKGFPPIHLMEGHSDTHTLLRGRDKATIRDAIRLQLQNLNEEQRKLVLEQRLGEIDRQMGRDPVYDAIRATRKPVSTEPPTRMAEQLRNISLPVSAIPVPHTTILPAKGAKPRQLPQNGPAEMLANALASKPSEARALIMVTPPAQAEVIPQEHRTQHRQVWISKGTNSKRIDRSEMSGYIADGWEPGRTVSKSWVTDGIESRQVSALVAEELLTRGWWEIGRQETLVKGSERRTAKPEDVGELLKSGWVFGMTLDGADDQLDETLPVEDSTINSNKELTLMPAEATVDADVDLDRVEAALARRRAKAQEPKSPTLEEFKTLQAQFKSLQDQNVAMQGEFARLKRLVLEFAAV